MTEKAALVVVLMHYNAFHEKSLKPTVILDNLVRYDRVIFDKLISPLMETICKVSRAHIRSDLKRMISTIDNTDLPTGHWFSKLENNLAILQSSQM